MALRIGRRLEAENAHICGGQFHLGEAPHACQINAQAGFTVDCNDETALADEAAAENFDFRAGSWRFRAVYLYRS
jgi:hypothetical protein